MHPFDVEQHIIGPGLVLWTWTHKDTGALEAAMIKVHKAGDRGSREIVLSTEDMDAIASWWQQMRRGE